MGLLSSASTYEGLRIVSAVCLIFAASWGLMHCQDGRYAYAKPIREKEIVNRRWKMLATLSVGLIWGAQSAVAGATVDAPLTVVSLLGSASILATLWILTGLALYQTARWAEYEGILAREPLSPSVQELIDRASAVGRLALHDMLDDLAVSVGAIELLYVSEKLSPQQAIDLEQALVGLSSLQTRIKALQVLMRGLGPDGDIPTAIETGGRS